MSTTKVTARYPIKIGDTLIEKGEVGRIATLEEARARLPHINYVAGSEQVSVIFRDLPPCIVLKKQIILPTP